MLNIRVQLTANTEAKIELINQVASLNAIPLLLDNLLDVISAKHNIPRVAKADNHKDISKIEHGENKTIMKTAIAREVKLSCVLAIRKSK